MHRKRLPTVRDVAKKAGVSPATASRVLSGTDYPVRTELRARILAAAEDLHYLPNGLARGLKSRTSPVIGVIVPSLTNPFYCEVAKGIEDASRDHRFMVLVGATDGRPQREEEFLRTLMEHRVAGLAIAVTAANAALIAEVRRAGVQVVAFDQTLSEAGIDTVTFNYRAGGRLATDFLMALGHRRIGFITAPLTRASRREVLAGYRLAHAEAGLAVDERLVLAADFEREYRGSSFELVVGNELAQRLFKVSELPTALLVINDLMALGVLRALSENGIRVPEDMSIVGFDDIALAHFSAPPLTTVEVPKYEMGQWVADTLIRRLGGAGESAERVNVVLEPQMVVRGTTGPPGARRPEPFVQPGPTNLDLSRT